jgi:hypothetical protein
VFSLRASAMLSSSLVSGMDVFDLDNVLGGCHSITSSALSSSDCGMVRPKAFAVLRLIASSNLIGCCTGNSAGLAPFRMRSI